eukprot:m.607224 g.607224  ORF g.607224 m.607224 type:complete len:126 (+) comp58118_c1_seq31:1142-1519(+)
MERKVQNLQACGKLFMDWSEDYFFVTRDIWNWDAMPPMVLGGVAVDNWLINKAVRTPGVLVVECSFTVHCIHQEHPNFSHSKANPRSDFNLGLAKSAGGWDRGKASDMPFVTYRENGRIGVKRRK